MRSAAPHRMTAVDLLGALMLLGLVVWVFLAVHAVAIASAFVCWSASRVVRP